MSQAFSFEGLGAGTHIIVNPNPAADETDVVLTDFTLIMTGVGTAKMYFDGGPVVLPTCPFSASESGARREAGGTDRNLLLTITGAASVNISGLYFMKKTPEDGRRRDTEGDEPA